MVRVGVTMVTVGVRVTDGKSREVHGLRAEDFSLYEDDAVQRIAFFSEEEQPFSLGIVLDRSDSMGEGDKLGRAKTAAISLVKAGHRDNEYLYIAFDNRADLATDFTTDRERLETAISNTVATGGTSLYDAILMALGRFAQARYPRQALVVITDGTDQHSFFRLDDVIRGLQASQVQLYFIGYFSQFEDRLFRNGPETLTRIDGQLIDNPHFVFRRLARETGAESFFPQSDDELHKAVQAISSDLQHQYTLAYYPPDPSREGYRLIEVNVRRRGLRVRARQGYRTSPGPAGARLPE